MRNLYSKNYLLLLICLAFSAAAFAQTGTLTGKILDDKRLELPGATVRITGTSQGTAADVNGNYKINLQPGTYTLLAQFIGYLPLSKQVTIKAGETTSLDFLLQAQSQSLNEIVVIGYGSAKRQDVTGSVATVTSKDFQKGLITTPEQLIAGKVAGVSVISNGGAPGAGSTIRIRGGASVYGSNDPLIVIDGVPVSNDGIAGAANPLNTINPNDIESFTILKDASAAAIYGNRASNGVILITTKKGQSGKPQINFSTQFSVSKLTKEYPVLTPDEFRTYVNANDKTSNGQYKSQLGAANTNWQKEIYQTSISTDNNLSVSGSAGKLPYRVSVGYTKQNGILKTSDLERYTGSLNLSPSLFNDHLKVNFNVKGTEVKQRFADQGAIGSAVSFNPTVPVYSGDDTKFGGYYEYLDPQSATGLKQNVPRNPLAVLELRDDHSNVYRAIASLGLDYRLHFFPDLHANVNIAYDGSRGLGSQSVPDYAAISQNTFTFNNVNYNGYYHTYKQTNENKLFEGFLSYNKDFKGISSHLDAVGGYSIQDFKTLNYNNPSFSSSGVLNPQSNPTFPLGTERYLLTSFYGRVNFVYHDKYILTGTIRNDYSTKFAPEDRSGVFPSGAFAWRINQEEFLKNSTVVSNLKLRLEYGKTGNQYGIGNYDYLGNYAVSTATAQYQLGNQFYYLNRPNAYYPGRTWETSATSNAAVDFGFLNDRITGSVDVYYRKTSRLLASISQPALTNFSNVIVGNIGNMQDKGIEMNINAQIIKKSDVSWTANFNVNYNKNEITNLSAIAGTSSSGLLTGGVSGGTGTTVQVNAVGSPKFSYYTYQQVYGPDGKPLDGVFADRNADGIVNENDLYINKNPNPKVFMGFSSDVNYKKWNAGFVARASLGNYIYNNIASYTGIQNYIINPIGAINNGSATVLQSGLIGNVDKDLLSDYWIENASFLRMDNAHIGYNFGKIIKGAGSLIISGNVQNVFIITKYRGADPEISSGIDNNFYPRPRTYVLGLNLSF
ncbi:SusC/RagA family TonB-linked outer membrane protein [Mucilaginibacter sp.]